MEFDQKYRLQSIPVIAGVRNALRISVLLHILSFAFVILAGVKLEANWIFWLGAVVYGGLMIYQHLIVKAGDLSRVNLAFGTTNGIAGVIFALFVIGSLYF